jgi:hypothetical protein
LNGSSPSGVFSRHQAIHQDFLPDEFKLASTPWIELSPTKKIAAVGDKLLEAMASQNLNSVPPRYSNGLPVFRLTRIGKSLELIGYILAGGLRSVFIDMRFSIIELAPKKRIPC